MSHEPPIVRLTERTFRQTLQTTNLVMPLAFLGLGLVAIDPIVGVVVVVGASRTERKNVLLLLVVILDEATLFSALGAKQNETQWTTPFSSSRLLMICVS